LGASYKYDPYGNTITQSGTLAGVNVYRFSSKMFYDTGNGPRLYYYGYRFYDPYTQRWLNRDPILENGGVNLYAFVGNRRINFVDTFGLSLRASGPTQGSGAACLLQRYPAPPIFEPGRWNDGGNMQYGNNCYSYACNKPSGHAPRYKPQPGGGCGADCASVIAGAKRDGAIDPGWFGTCPSGFHKVHAFVDPGVDYHWYREDSAGDWSHKPGWGDATNVDASGNPISDPCKANRDYSPSGPNYSQDCGALCVPN
jgi:RHS repeat-associated protein